MSILGDQLVTKVSPPSEKDKQFIRDCMYLAKQELTVSEILGLQTEEQCWDALNILGDRKFRLKNALVENSKSSDNEFLLKRISSDIEQVHKQQLAIINDVCKRFDVIHPEILSISPELISLKRTYWQWYTEMWKKREGSEDIPDFLVKALEEEKKKISRPSLDE